MPFYILLLIFIPLYITSEGQHKNFDITGIWLTPENRSAIKIYKTGNYYEGKIIWEKETFDKKGNQNKDIYNPNSKLRNRLLHGLVIMTNISFDKNSKKGKGKIYNLENVKIFKINLELISNNTPEVRGYIRISLIGRTYVWKRKTKD